MEGGEAVHGDSQKNFTFFRIGRCTWVHGTAYNALCILSLDTEGKRVCRAIRATVAFPMAQNTTARWSLLSKRAVGIPEICKEVPMQKKIHYIFRRRLCRAV